MRLLRNWLLLALLLHLIAAVFSVGYYHSDEHFQILEFMSYKLGRTPEAALPVEFHQMLRSWLQPAIYLALARVAGIVGVESPFTQTLLLRLFSALIGWLSLVALLRASRAWLSERGFRLACAASALLWFMPALHARLSSENLSGAVFFIAFGWLLASKRRGAWILLPGFLLGLSFELRFQLGFMIAGFGAWLLAARGSPIAGRKLSATAWLGTGFILALALAACLDRWGYGRWVMTPWNYFRYNIVENHVADIDSQPFWDFFRSSFTETWPPLGFVCLVSWIFAWVRFPRNVLSCATLPLLLIHVLVGHKELRFLFPIAHAAPVLLAMAVQDSRALARIPRWMRATAGTFLTFDNTVALGALCFLPAWMPARLYKDVYARAMGPSAAEGPFELHYTDRNPYEILGSTVYYYRPPGLRLTHLDGPSAFSAAEKTHPEGIWLFDARPVSQAAQNGPPGCTLRFTTLPLWLAGLGGTLTQRMSDWILYQCKGPG